MQSKLSGPTPGELLSQAQNKLIENLQASEKRYQDLVGHLRDVVFHLDLNLKWTFLNQAWFTLTGFTVGESLGREFGLGVDPDDAARCSMGFSDLLSEVKKEITEEIRFYHSDGDCRVFELSARAVRDETGQYAGFAGILSDITARVEAENKITFMAYHDALTGVANRRLLMEHLGRELTGARPSCAALIYIDLDNFKQVNDHHGHGVGDQLLYEVSQALREYAPNNSDLVARMGGDEFVIFLSGLDPDNPRNELIEITENIRKRLNKPVLLGYLTTQITSSIGVVMLDKPNIQYSEIFKFADAALYCAKHAGKNQVRFYDDELEQSERLRQQLEVELADAIRRQEFILYFQPQTDKTGKQITKAEALLRWHHPQKGVVPPREFIPHLEEYGLIIPVGNWILEESCRHLKKWQEAGNNKLCLSVNVSANQFNHPDFLAFVEQCLRIHNIDGHQLEFELTEGIAIADVPATISKMNTLKSLGIRIALDDFGTGYSSLSYLKHLPISTLKIDRSFVQGLPHDGYDAAIVETTMVMAHHLGLTVVAEGVENRIQLDFLKKLNCHLYQGYLFHKPMAEEEFSKLIL
ncbi:EAL domain-containing protein [Shewanella submarina]|uniref:Bifunctional diguanylate cyclase/phosphodiesterase n=1 Tax=Shewanella submarina TaxID=2016376 RepID=A0ABV7G7D5_9GAMM|nr:GGDEF domain-containing phosphodiesterase [Shewanella submarina]MCL1037176.1 EAL domain-containing protein [Shewanella submarina]